MLRMSTFDSVCVCARARVRAHVCVSAYMHMCSVVLDSETPQDDAH